MQGLKELKTILDPAASDADLLSALNCLKAEHLHQELLNAAVQEIGAAADIHPDLALELYELGRFSMDCSGTGGSGMAHFNTSTSVAFVLAAAGFKIAKFGGRAASGKSGSFDFLESLGFNAVPLPRVADALSVCGLAFILAPSVYPQLKRLAPLRKQLAVPTLFNYIGPLLNPVHPATRLMGISSDLARRLAAENLRQNPRTNRALLVTGAGRMDEISLDSHSEISLIEGTELQEFQLSPESFNGLFHNDGTDGKGLDYDSKTNSKIFLEIISGEDSKSHAYRMIVLNSAAALYVMKASKSISEGIVLATELIASRAVAESLQTCRRFYAQLS